MENNRLMVIRDLYALENNAKTCWWGTLKNFRLFQFYNDFKIYLWTEDKNRDISVSGF